MAGAEAEERFHPGFSLRPGWGAEARGSVITRWWLIRRSFLHAASRGTDTSRRHGNRKARCYAIIGPVLLTAQPHSQVCQRLQMRNYTMVCGGRGRGSERVSERKRKSLGPSPFLIRSFFLYFALFLSLSLRLYLSIYSLDSFCVCVAGVHL